MNALGKLEAYEARIQVFSGRVATNRMERVVKLGVEAMIWQQGLITASFKLQARLRVFTVVRNLMPRTRDVKAQAKPTH